MANHRRDIERALAHILEHLESAKSSAETGNITSVKTSIDLVENIIRQAQRDSIKSKRKEDEDNKSNNSKESA